MDFHQTSTVKPQWLEHWWLVYRGWFKLFFSVPTKFSNSSRKQIFRNFFLFYHGIVCCVYSLDSHSTYNRCVENRKDFPKLSLFASWTGAMINPQWLDPPMSNKFPWSQRCSSHWGSTVCALILWRSGLGLLMGKFHWILTALSARDTPIFSFSGW